VNSEPSLILLAEDNDAISMLLQEVFEDEGYTVTSCSSAAEVIDTLENLSPALVISDLQMEHVLAGLHLLRHMREMPHMQATPVIVYSADTFLLKTLEPQIVQLNAAMIAKPFHIDALVALVHRLIRLTAREASS